MVTFLVLSIIMTIVTAGAAIVATIALSIWSTVVVDISNCETVAGQCVCYNEYYGPDTYNGKITEFMQTQLRAKLYLYW